MSQDAVEKLLGRLITDDDFRDISSKYFISDSGHESEARIYER